MKNALDELIRRLDTADEESLSYRIYPQNPHKPKNRDQDLENKNSISKVCGTTTKGINILNEMTKRRRKERAHI